MDNSVRQYFNQLGLYETKIKTSLNSIWALLPFYPLALIFKQKTKVSFVG